jgi:hypothetical protein
MTPSIKNKGGVNMKNDYEVKLYMSERRKGIGSGTLLVMPTSVLEHRSRDHLISTRVPGDRIEEVHAL